MSCLCAQTLRAFAAQFRLPPLALPIPSAVASVSASLQAFAAAQAAASFQAGLGVGLPPLSVAASVKLAALASASASLQAAMSAQASAALSATVQSINLNAPLLLPTLRFGNPLLYALAQLAAMIQDVLNQFKIDLRQPGAVAQLQAALNAQAALYAQASASAQLGLGLSAAAPSLTAAAALSATASASASAHFGVRAMLQVAAAFGLNATAPDFVAQLKALVAALAALLPPLLTLPPLAIGGLTQMFAAVGSINAVFGVNLAAGASAVASLQATLGAMNLAALAGLQVPTLAATASATASASAQASAAFDAALAPLSLSALASLNLANALLGLLKPLGLTPQTSPCGECVILAAPARRR